MDAANRGGSAAASRPQHSGSHRTPFQSARTSRELFENMDSFQETLFKLKNYWSDRGCIIQEPYDMRSRRGHHVPGDLPARARPEPLPRRLCAAQPPPGRRPLWRESEPPLQAPAVSGDPEAVARRHHRSVPREPRSHRHRSRASTTSSSKRTTGNRPRSAPGASAGR